MNLPARNMSFQQEYDATITDSEDLNLIQHSRASSSFQHTAASRVPTLLSLTKVSADCDSVASRTRIKETCADMGRLKQLFQVFSGLCEKGKRDRDRNVVQTLRDKQNRHKILERKAGLAVRQEKLAQQRFFGAEADVEVKHLEKRNSDVALYEINQEFESRRNLRGSDIWSKKATAKTMVR